MAHICFYTTELSPVTRGGLGALLWDALHALPAQGHDVTILADFDREAVAQFNRDHAPGMPGPGAVTVHWLPDLAPAMAGRESQFFSPALYHSFAAKEALVELIAQRATRFDLVEFPDFQGSAYYSLVEKRLGRRFASTPIAVRAHGTLEHWTSFEAFPATDLEAYVAGGLERYCLRHADWVFCPSPAWAEVCRERYGTPEERVLIAPPTLVARDLPRAVAETPTRDVIICHGKLQQTKGVDLFVDAAVRWLASGEGPTGARFVMTGADMHRSPELTSEVRFLQERIPARFRPQFEFIGHIPRATLGELLRRARFAVIPSRAETFGYAAHEMRAAGVPVIVSDIPGFAGAFEDGVNCLKFDGSVSGLHEQMRRLTRDSALCERLRNAPPIAGQTPGRVYGRHLAPQPATAAEPVRRVTVIVLADDGEGAAAQRTLWSVARSEDVTVAAWRLTPWTPQCDGAPLRFHGRSWKAHDPDGAPVTPPDVRLAQAAVVLRAGDVVAPRYLATACAAMTRDATVGVVASWQRHDGLQSAAALAALIGMYPWETIPELAPIIRGRLLSRGVFRSSPDTTLDRWIDERYGDFGDIALAWEALERGMTILTIPDELVSCRPESAASLRLSAEDAGRLSLLLGPDRHHWLQGRLPQLLELIITGAATEAGPVTAARLGLVSAEGEAPPPAPRAPADDRQFYGRKWLLRQLLRELVRAPLPGFLRKEREAHHGRK